MNLPASAPEFMDAFRGAFPPSVWPPDSLPRVHLYAFSKNSEPLVCEADIKARAEAALGFPIPGPTNLLPTLVSTCEIAMLRCRAGDPRRAGEIEGLGCCVGLEIEGVGVDVGVVLGFCVS
eukprot:3326907-Rhodomonas_salina.1